MGNGFTPEEAAKIPFGIMESVVRKEMDDISEQSQRMNETLQLYREKYELLKSIMDQSDAIKWKYAKGEIVG